ncbi:hypothetical protein [Paenibacillus chitinolyticus]|uniref:hypothetical protein n=1 Tax=Paenibacillus chitinolyticus TaxID=79263 RepID=UPI00295E2AD6|nr:hypothetical protein [Paenibacillus chitinolyticus]
MDRTLPHPVHVQEGYSDKIAEDFRKVWSVLLNDLKMVQLNGIQERNTDGN